MDQVSPDQMLRALLTVEALTAVLLAGYWLGTIWHHRGWPLRLIALGGLGVLIYVLLGQVKAFNLGIPFDWFSTVGLASYAVLFIGLTWHVRERIQRRGR